MQHKPTAADMPWRIAKTNTSVRCATWGYSRQVLQNLSYVSLGSLQVALCADGLLCIQLDFVFRVHLANRNLCTKFASAASIQLPFCLYAIEYAGMDSSPMYVIHIRHADVHISVPYALE